MERDANNEFESKMRDSGRPDVVIIAENDKMCVVELFRVYAILSFYCAHVHTETTETREACSRTQNSVDTIPSLPHMCCHSNVSPFLRVSRGCPVYCFVVCACRFPHTPVPTLVNQRGPTSTKPCPRQLECIHLSLGVDAGIGV